MIYAAVSSEEVIGRIIRNTRMQDTSFIPSFNVWIPEAMGMMRTKVEVQKREQIIDISFFKGEIPCGLIDVRAVEYKGHRLSQINGVGKRTHRREQSQNIFQSVPIIKVTDSGHAFNDSTALPFTECYEHCMNLSCSDDWYDTELNAITTSFEHGKLKLYFTQMAIDSNGLPMIPDNEDYKEALYWYSRGRMIGAGWEDPVFRFDYCDAKWEKHAERARSHIRYPSVNQMQMRINGSVRLIKDPHYFDKYFTTPNAEPFYG